MKIISDRQAVLIRLEEARNRQVPILSPNAETPDEMEAILLAAQQFAVETNSARVTMGMGITAAYPDHPQLVRLHPLARWQDAFPDAITPAGGLLPVALRWLDWLDSYTRDPWFDRVEVIPFWDHGWVPLEAQLLTNAALVKRMGIIFFDASALPFEENVKLTAAYVARFGSRVVVEGCPDKIASQAEIQAATDLKKHSALSKPAQVREFVRRTGVDLVVPSLGTEHRGLPGESIRYRTALARRLRAENGNILVLHGTSSLGDRIAAVGCDGIVKVNFYTGAARAAGAALREAWSTQPSPLPIEAAAGSFVHATRREAVRREVFALLKRLGTTRKTQPKRNAMNRASLKATPPNSNRLRKTIVGSASRILAVMLAGMICPWLLAGEPAAENQLVAPQLNGGGLEIRHELQDGKLRQVSMLPAGVTNQLAKVPADPATGMEVELQVTGLNWSAHHAKKLIGGNPGTKLIYRGQETLESKLGRHEVLLQQSPELGLRVESHYEFFQDIPVVRRWSRIVNEGHSPVGIEEVSSAMVYNFANFGPNPLEQKLRVYYANNSWMSEAQWQSSPPSRWGLLENGFFSLTAIVFNNLGSYSTMSQLPVGMAENRDLGVTWFWQIEHNGSWHWEISDTGNHTSYLYLGGPDELFSQAWKQLQPGQGYDSVPVAVGCVQGGFDEAVAAMTAYRRKACLLPHQDNVKCPVIFNDYMNCLNADPTTEKELPVIDAAAAAGCEYYVIDAGWYAELKESWWESVGLWQPSKTRFGTNGLTGVLDYIRAKGMTPGLWLEIEVAGINSPLKDKPDSWFFLRHGRRVIANGRYLLDFRNPEVRAHADEVVNRLVGKYRVGYLKIDYNVEALLGTETQADSLGQGLLEHQRAYLKWIDAVHQRFPDLVIENCGSGGGRMDYGMLSHHELQSSSDQSNYRQYPSIVAGALAAVLPEQLAVWSYPKAEDDADAASFNMVNAMLARIHQSGGIANLKDESRKQVHAGIRIYKEKIRQYLPHLTPFYPLGLPPSMADTKSPVAVGLRDSERAFVAVWRLAGADTVSLPNNFGGRISLLYPTDLGIKLECSSKTVEIKFPRPYMAAILEVTK